MNEDAQKVTLSHVDNASSNIGSMTLTQMLANFSKYEWLALSGYVSVLRDAKIGGVVPTTSNIHKAFVWNCKNNGCEPVSETMMKNYLSRLEGSKIIDHETKNYERRGRTNVYVSDYRREELDIALLR